MALISLSELRTISIKDLRHYICWPYLDIYGIKEVGCRGYITKRTASASKYSSVPYITSSVKTTCSVVHLEMKVVISVPMTPRPECR